VLLGRVLRGRVETAPQQLLVIDDPEQIALLREQGENTIEIENVFLQVVQVVRTGLYLMRMEEINTDENTFAAAFSVWFRFKGDFDAEKILFSNAVDTITLKEPAREVRLPRESYERYDISGTFGFSPGIESLRSSRQVFEIMFQHAERDVNQLVFLPDTLAMGIDGSEGGWEQDLRARDVLDPATGWVVSRAAAAQEVINQSTRGNPLVPTVQVPFSAFLASIEALQPEFSLRVILSDAFPPVVLSWLVVVGCVAVLALTFERRIRSRFAVPVFFLRLALTAVLLVVTEDLFFRDMADGFEVYELGLVVNVFRSLWWLLPAVWLSLLVKRAVWEPMERRTGYPIPSIARLFVNLAIFGIAAACIMTFVFEFSLATIWAASGVVTIVLGIALQTLILDAATGLMINMERPFRLGQWVRIGVDGDVRGRVTEMNWRTTRVETDQNDTVIVPNSIIGQSSLVNYNEPSDQSGVEVAVRVGYSVPVEEVKACLLMVADDAARAGAILADPPPAVSASASSGEGILYKLQVNFLVREGEWDDIETEMIAAIQKALADRGIEFWDPTAGLSHLRLTYERA